MNRQESGALSTFLMGAVVGAGVALLFKPGVGVQMRRRLSDYVAQAKDEFDKTIDHGAEMLDSAVEHGQEFVEKGKHSLRKTSHAALEERLIYPATREAVTRCIFT